MKLAYPDQDTFYSPIVPLNKAPPQQAWVEVAWSARHCTACERRAA